MRNTSHYLQHDKLNIEVLIVTELHTYWLIQWDSSPQLDFNTYKLLHL